MFKKKWMLNSIFVMSLFPCLSLATVQPTPSPDTDPNDNLFHTTIFHTQGKKLDLEVNFAIGYGDDHVCIRATGRTFKDTVTDNKVVSLGGEHLAEEFGPKYNCVQESFKVLNTGVTGSMTYTLFSNGEKYVGAYPPVANINL